MSVGNLEEIIDDSHAIVSSSVGPEYYVNILSFVDKGQLEPGCSVLMHNKALSIVGTLSDEVDPMVSVMKVDKAPLESYADVGGLETQIQEIKEAVELPLTHPELYEDIGIKPPKGVCLYGEPGTGKTLLAKAVANSTSATFLRVVGSELIQKYLGDGPKLVRCVSSVTLHTHLHTPTCTHYPVVWRKPNPCLCQAELRRSSHNSTLSLSQRHSPRTAKQPDTSHLHRTSPCMQLPTVTARATCSVKQKVATFCFTFGPTFLYLR
jgi:hypothetical protein